MAEITKPNALTLINLASAYKIELFTLEPETEVTEYDFDKVEDRKKFFANNGVYGIGRLSGNQLLEFEVMFKKTLDKVIACWFAASMFEFDRNSEQTESTVTYDEDSNTYITPAGKMVGSPESNILRVIAFLFSCWGRIVDEDDSGNYVFSRLSMSEILDFMDYNYLQALSVNEDDGAEAFIWKVLNIARGFDTTAIGATTDSEEDDEAKNSTIPSLEKEPSTKSASKRGATKQSKKESA